MRAAAVRALGALKYERAVPPLTELVTAGKSDTAEAALDALAHIASASSAPLFQARLHDQAKRYLVEIAPGREALFARHFLDPAARIRFEVAGVFLRSGDPRALTLVEPLGRDKDPAVALLAGRAVRRMRLMLPPLQTLVGPSAPPGPWRPREP